MKRILVGFDGSEPALRALDFAATVAKRLDARLSVVYVVEPFVFPADLAPQAIVDLTERHREYAEKLLEGAVARLSADGLQVERLVEVGSPAAELVRLAADPEVSLLVVGTSGRGLSARLLLGSVANRVLHHCEKPVLIVR